MVMPLPMVSVAVLLTTTCPLLFREPVIVGDPEPKTFRRAAGGNTNEPERSPPLQLTFPFPVALPLNSLPVHETSPLILKVPGTLPPVQVIGPLIVALPARAPLATSNPALSVTVPFKLRVPPVTCTSPLPLPWVPSAKEWVLAEKVMSPTSKSKMPLFWSTMALKSCALVDTV